MLLVLLKSHWASRQLFVSDFPSRTCTFTFIFCFCAFPASVPLSVFVTIDTAETRITFSTMSTCTNSSSLTIGNTTRGQVFSLYQHHHFLFKKRQNSDQCRFRLGMQLREWKVILYSLMWQHSVTEEQQDTDMTQHTKWVQIPKRSSCLEFLELVLYLLHFFFHSIPTSGMFLIFLCSFYFFLVLLNDITSNTQAFSNCDSYNYEYIYFNFLYTLHKFYFHSHVHFWTIMYEWRD